MEKFNNNFIKKDIIKVEAFEPLSLAMFWVDKEAKVEAIVGKQKSGKVAIQSFVFNRANWDETSCSKWIEGKGSNRLNNLINNKTTYASNIVLCEHLPNLKLKDNDVVSLTEELMTKGSLLFDKYYFYTKSVHEHQNKNDDYFYRDEITANFQSMSYQPLDWEHDREQLIGTSLEAHLVTDDPEKYAIGWNGIIWRLSPHMQVEYSAGISRDDEIRQRYFQHKLFTSMETIFDEIKCTGCGARFNNFLDFEFHRFLEHPNEVIYRGLIGIAFIGNGIIKNPADEEADVSSLRTSDDGTLAISVAHILKEEITNSKVYNKVRDKYGDSSLLFAAANYVANIEEKKIKIEIKEPEKVIKQTGGNSIMFKLKEKCEKATKLSEIWVIAQKTLKDLKGDNPVTAEMAKAFSEELAVVINEKFLVEAFDFNEMNTLTETAKLEAITKAREEEQVEKANALKVKEDEIVSLKAENAAKQAQIVELQTKIDTLNKAEAEKIVKEKTETFLKELESVGVKLTDTMKKVVGDSIKDKLDDETALKDAKKDIIASFAQSKLEAGSAILEAIIPGAVPSKSGTFMEKLDELGKEYKK